MLSFNKIILVGTTGADANVREVSGDLTVGSFSVATSAGKDKPTQWHNVVYFAKHQWQKGILEQIKKGTPVFVEGSISYESYEKNGEKKFITKVIASVVNPFVAKGSGRQASANNSDDIPF